MIEIEVTYVGFPDIDDGVLGFYHRKGAKRCTEPHYRYEQSEVSHGFCHTRNADEMDSLAVQIGAKTRNEFIKDKINEGHKSWKNAYGKYLSGELGRRLQDGGILLTIDGTETLFFCKPDQFVEW
jgi:hypothetical protein